MHTCIHTHTQALSYLIPPNPVRHWYHLTTKEIEAQGVKGRVLESWPGPQCPPSAPRHDGAPSGHERTLSQRRRGLRRCARTFQQSVLKLRLYLKQWVFSPGLHPKREGRTCPPPASLARPDPPDGPSSWRSVTRTEGSESEGRALPLITERAEQSNTEHSCVCASR